MQPGSLPHSDAVMVMHINADLTKAYITSLPRDLLVNVPAFGPSGSGADFTKLTHAMTYGSRVPGTNQQNTRQGFALLAQTVSAYTGISHFDAGGLLTFTGLAKLVDVIGGIDIYVDYPVTSIHVGPPDGRDTVAIRRPVPALSRGHAAPQRLAGAGLRPPAVQPAQRGVRPRAPSPPDRQGDDHARSSASTCSNFPFVAPYVVQAVGQVLTLDLRGRKIHEYAYALRNLRPEAVTLVGLPGGLGDRRQRVHRRVARADPGLLLRRRTVGHGRAVPRRQPRPHQRPTLISCVARSARS